MVVRRTSAKPGLEAGSVGTVTEIYPGGKKEKGGNYQLRVNYGTGTTPDLFYEFYYVLKINKH